jgi:hypothetical protein
LQSELILALYDKRIGYDTFMELYRQTLYKRGKADVKRNNALIRTTPQTHTHGGSMPNVDDALDYLRLMLNNLIGLMASISLYVKSMGYL